MAANIAQSSFYSFDQTRLELLPLARLAGVVSQERMRQWDREAAYKGDWEIRQEGDVSSKHHLTTLSAMNGDL